MYRYNISPNSIAQIIAIYKRLLSVFRDTCRIFDIQIPSGAVLPTSLLCKETQKVTRLFDRLKAKNRGWRGLINRSNPCFSGIFLYLGLFCSYKQEKTSLVLVDKRGFFRGGRGWIRTTEGEASRFTVCPLWPLGNSPKSDDNHYTTGATLCQ